MVNPRRCLKLRNFPSATSKSLLGTFSPTIHGCLRACSTDKRRRGSRTSSCEIKFLASADIPSQLGLQNKQDLRGEQRTGHAHLSAAHNLPVKLVSAFLNFVEEDHLIVVVKRRISAQEDVPEHVDSNIISKRPVLHPCNAKNVLTYTMTPSDHMSTDVSYGFACRISGATYLRTHRTQNRR